MGASAARMSMWCLASYLTSADGMKTWSPQNTERRPRRLEAYTPVCFTTASRMVMGTWFSLTSTMAGSLTPDLLLFSLPGSGARRVPLPAVWYSATLMLPAASSAGMSMP